MNNRNEHDQRYYFKTFINAVYFFLAGLVLIFLFFLIYLGHRQVQKVYTEKKAYIYMKPIDLNLTELTPGKRLYYESLN